MRNMRNWHVFSHIIYSIYYKLFVFNLMQKCQLETVPKPNKLIIFKFQYIMYTVPNSKVHFLLQHCTIFINFSICEDLYTVHVQ